MLKKEEVLHIARLARLDLKEEEVEKFSTQLSAVLDLFKKIDEIDLTDKPETSQVTGLKNITRPDEITCKEGLTCCTSEELLSDAPSKDESSIKVPKIIGGSNDA